MDKLNFTHILDRYQQEKKIIEWLEHFEKNKTNILIKRGIYIYGPPGSGKTYFTKQILKKINYDIILFDAGDVRNKSAMESITKHNISNTNIISLFNKNKKKMAIIMDEIDGMNSGDKGGINSLIRLIRPKKTRKQKKENTTMIPIICIGNYHIDKKITELMKVCNIIELTIPTHNQIRTISNNLMPHIASDLLENIINFVQGDLRKLSSIYKIYNHQQNSLKKQLIQNMFQSKSLNEDTKQITTAIVP